jgi:replicative DNA helicase
VISDPNDLDAEAAVLATVLLNPRALDDLEAILAPEHFYADSHQRIYETAVELSRAGKKVDVLTVKSRLSDKGQLQAIGGATYLAELMDKTPAVAHVSQHAQRVTDLYRLRALMTECRTITALSHEHAENVSAWLDEADSRIHSVAVNGEVALGARNAKEVLQRVFSEISGATEIPGLKTGLVDLDHLLCGLRAGQLIVIGAHSGVGKSALASHIAVDVAVGQRDRSVGLFSLEMSAEELAMRMLFAEARVDSTKVGRPKWITEQDWKDLAGSVGVVAVENLWIDDTAGLSVTAIRARAKRLSAACNTAKKPLGLVVVDYAQLIGSEPGKRTSNREQEVAEVSRSLKRLARELSCPLIVLAQLNDQDADKVILIYNPQAVERSAVQADHKKPPTPSPDGEVVDLIVDKNRGGSLGTARALFFPQFTRFDNLSQE